MTKYRAIICTSKSWLPNEYYHSLIRECELFFITKKADLYSEVINKYRPNYIFFPHWSYIIPKEIYENSNCVIFHMTDLPFGRGGSPLQNLIKRKIKKTRISAIKCISELDAGPIFLKKDLDLTGSAQEIYMRASKIIVDMIKEIITNNIQPTAQVGEVVNFERRKPSQSEMSDINNLEDLYDHIRMLDANGYPKAYINREGINYQFSNAKFSDDGVLHAQVELRVSHDS